MNSYPAIRVNQWRSEWDAVHYENKAPRRKPKPYFYVLSMPARTLKSLSGVEQRTTSERLKGLQDLNLQRKLDQERAKEIAAFVENGFPWSDLSENKREDPDYAGLRMPGWLPGAIIINVKEPGDERSSGLVAMEDIVKFKAEGGLAKLILPASYAEADWRPKGSQPIEVIDGQHRLWAFNSSDSSSFELPVVAFHGLDITWQAYLFYVINIKPKKINPSLAYDLYPLLRNVDWLNRIEGHLVYRDTRSQELTEILWSHPKSPWHQRINMLGTTGPEEPQVRQASWVRNLTNAMVKRGEGSHVTIGGLLGGDETGSIPWTRTEQAGFLIFAWDALERAIKKSDAKWAKALRAMGSQGDPAFSGKLTLLNTDQGVRGFLHVLNDMMMVKRTELGLELFRSDTPIDEPTQQDISRVIDSFAKNKLISGFVRAISDCLASFDWRTADAPNLDENEKTIKKTFRGSGGYKELRVRLLRELEKCKGETGAAAKEVKRLMGYE